MAIYIDTENPATSPALECVSVKSEKWNGFAVPVVTAQAFQNFIAAWHAMDPNGTWEPRGISVDRKDSRLVYRDGDGNDDFWELYGVTKDGENLYALDGWTWIEA